MSDGVKYFYIGKQQALFIRNDGTKVLLDLRDVGTLNFITSDIYEPDVTGAIKQLLKPGGTFIDVGANLGIHTLMAWRHLGKSGRVFAIEPNKHIFRLMRQSLQLNG